MGSGVVADVDAIEELRLRLWARRNYVSAEFRAPTWHPIVLEEMGRKDEETIAEPAAVIAASAR